MNFKRVCHRIVEEFDATRKIARVTSWSDAITTFIAKVDIQIMNHNGYKEYPWFKRHLLKKHEVMMNYLEDCYKDFIATYDFDNVPLDSDSRYSDVIWVCWWQGEEQAPDIVKKCLATIRANAPGHKVIIITEDNYRDFVTFPEWVERKRKAGIMSRTHYSDLLRLSLLSKYGGMWVDSTFFCTGDISQYFAWPLWSIKRPDYFHASVASGYFANYSLGCDFEHRKVFAIIRDFTLYYWKKYDSLIDYLFLDYLIVLAQRHCKYVRESFANLHPNNPQCDELYKVLGEPYDEQKWKDMKRDTNMFKLTWKYQYPLEKDSKPTFYGMLLNGMLN